MFPKYDHIPSYVATILSMDNNSCYVKELMYGFNLITWLASYVVIHLGTCIQNM